MKILLIAVFFAFVSWILTEIGRQLRKPWRRGMKVDSRSKYARETVDFRSYE